MYQTDIRRDSKNHIDELDNAELMEVCENLWGYQDSITAHTRAITDISLELLQKVITSGMSVLCFVLTVTLHQVECLFQSGKLPYWVKPLM